MPDKKGLQDFDESVKKAGAAIGQILGRFQANLDKTGKQAIKTAKELVETVSKTTEKTMESTMVKIHEATADKTHQPPAFKSIKGKAVGDSVKLVADEVLAHLKENGKVTVDELVAAMAKKRRNQGMAFAAMGWLAGQGKVRVTKDGKNISAK